MTKNTYFIKNTLETSPNKEITTPNLQQQQNPRWVRGKSDFQS
jgi:hypothetical protein